MSNKDESICCYCRCKPLKMDILIFKMISNWHSAVSANVTGIFLPVSGLYHVYIWLNCASSSFRCVKQRLQVKHQPKRESYECSEKEWKWNQVPWLSVCAPTVHVRVREGGMGGKGGGGGEKKVNLHLWNGTAHWDADDKQYKQQQSRTDEAVNDIEL